VPALETYQPFLAHHSLTVVAIPHSSTDIDMGTFVYVNSYITIVAKEGPIAMLRVIFLFLSVKERLTHIFI